MGQREIYGGRATGVCLASVQRALKSVLLKYENKCYKLYLLTTTTYTKWIYNITITKCKEKNIRYLM